MSSNSLYDSRKFSEDISRDMQIPERIGATGAMDSATKGFGMNSSYPTFSNIVEDMNIPDRILATGEAAASNMASYEYDPLDPSLQVRPGDLISIDSPPDTITLDRMQYPDIGMEAEKPSSAVTVARRVRRGRTSSSEAAAAELQTPSGAALAIGGAGANVSMAVLRLQKRLDALEAENEQRRRRELVLYPAIGLYFLMKIVNWFLRPRRMPGQF